MTFHFSESLSKISNHRKCYANIRGSLMEVFHVKGGSGTGVSCEFCKICKSTFSYRTPQMAAS